MPVAQRESERSLSEGVTTVFTEKKHNYTIRHLEFGSVCPIERPQGAEGILTLIIHIN